MSNSKPAQQGGTQTPAQQQGQSDPKPAQKPGGQQQGGPSVIRDWASI